MTQPAGDWYAREAVAPGITRLWEPAVHRFFRANIFHVRGREADLVVDFGMGLAPLHPALGLTAGKPVIAVATHSHADHIGAFHAFDIRAGHPAEAGIFAGVADAATLAHLFRDQPEPVTALPHAGWLAGGFRLSPAPLTLPLGEGAVVDLGDRRFTVLHLPGHSPGSIGLLDNTGGDFFTGDALYQGQLVDDVPGADIPAYCRTMARLAALDAGRVFGGHGPVIDGAAMRAIARRYVSERTGAA